MNSFNIYENQKIEDEELKAKIQKSEKLKDFFSNSWGEVRADNYVGFLKIDDLNVTILPKIESDEKNNLKYLLFMLSKKDNLEIKNEDLSNLDSKKVTFFDVFVKMFVIKLQKELQRGIYKEYHTIQENCSAIKGKYLVLENMMFNFKNEKIYCEYDKFSEDNRLNRFFLYTIKYLQRFSNMLELRQIEKMFDEVSYTNFDISRDIGISFNRLNERFKESYEIALMLLKNLLPINSDSKNLSFLFLFKMYELFEKFIAILVRDIDSSARTQYNSKLFNQKLFEKFNIRADILLDDMIIDTKYKKIESRDDINQSDIYQVLSYAKVYKKNKIMLLYPKFNDYEAEFIQDDVTLYIKQIELQSKKDSFDEYIKEKIINIKRILI